MQNFKLLLNVRIFLSKYISEDTNDKKLSPDDVTTHVSHTKKIKL